MGHSGEGRGGGKIHFLSKRQRYTHSNDYVLSVQNHLWAFKCRDIFLVRNGGPIIAELHLFLLSHVTITPSFTFAHRNNRRNWGALARDTGRRKLSTRTLGSQDNNNIHCRIYSERGGFATAIALLCAAASARLAASPTWLGIYHLFSYWMGNVRLWLCFARPPHQPPAIYSTTCSGARLTQKGGVGWWASAVENFHKCRLGKKD